MSTHHSASAWWLMVAVPTWLILASPIVGMAFLILVLILMAVL